MKFIENTKAYFGQRAIRMHLRSNPRKVKTCSIERAERIGILFNATHQVSFEIVKDLVKDITTKKNTIDVVGYVDSKQMIDHYLYRKGFEFFTRNQLNWYYKPIDEAVQRFVDNEYDLLMDLSLDNPFPIRYILACSKAKFKAGRYSELEEYLDFMIDIEKENREMMDLKKQVDSSSIGGKVLNGELEKIVDSKIQTEIQLNFLIKQLIHYLSLLKN
jgi:hypothetical protein